MFFSEHSVDLPVMLTRTGPTRTRTRIKPSRTRTILARTRSRTM